MSGDDDAGTADTDDFETVLRRLNAEFVEGVTASLDVDEGLRDVHARAASRVEPDPAGMPGGPAAVGVGCLCEPVDNRGGRGVGPLAAYLDDDGVARRYDSPVYLVDPDCPIHPLPDTEVQ